MASSPTTAPQTTSGARSGASHSQRPDLLTLLGSVPDPRDPRGVRHRLPAILAVGLAAVLAGARSFVAIGEWVAHQTPQTLTPLGVAGAGPGESTIRRAFARVDADTVDRVLGAFMWTRTFEAGGRRVIAIDGKTIRGPRSADQAAPHLVAALDHAAGAVLGQVAVTAKSNEIPAVQGLLRASLICRARSSPSIVVGGTKCVDRAVGQRSHGGVNARQCNGLPSAAYGGNLGGG